VGESRKSAQPARRLTLKLVSWNIENILPRLAALPQAVKELGAPDVYAVNGTAKPYFDETARVAGDRHQLKRRFQNSVMDLGRDLRRDGGVIMAGDWNVSRTAQDTYPRLRTEQPHARARAELNARMTDEGFVDIWRERHPDERAYTWFNRRARGLDAARVDYVLVSEDIVPRVRSVEILDLLPWSDHAPVRLEL
jgi:exonuclease III